MFSPHKQKKTDSEYATELLSDITDVDRINTAVFLGNLAGALTFATLLLTRETKPSTRYWCVVSDGKVDRSFSKQLPKQKEPSRSMSIAFNSDAVIVQALIYNKEKYSGIEKITPEDLKEGVKVMGLGGRADVVDLWFLAAVLYSEMRQKDIPVASIIMSSEIHANALSQTPTGLLVYTPAAIVEYRLVD